MATGPALVVRLSSLGDVLLAAHLPSLLRAASPGRRVLFLTKERFAGVLRGHPDVDRFYVLEDCFAEIGPRQTRGSFSFVGRNDTNWPKREQ